MYFASYFSWCGHVARVTKVDPKRNESHFYGEKHLVVADIEEITGIAMSWTSIQGADSGAVCWQ